DQRIAVGIRNVRQNQHSDRAATGDTVRGGRRTSDRGHVVIVFVRADINHAADDARESALVGGGSVRVVARVQRGAAAEQRVGKGGAAVVLQRADFERRSGDVKPVIRSWRNDSIGRAEQIKTAGGR